MPAYAILALAIIGEVVATSALKASAGFTRLLPSLLVIAGYGAAFYFLSLVLDRRPLGIAYAIWAGGGIALVVLAGSAFYGASRLCRGRRIGADPCRYSRDQPAVGLQRALIRVNQS